MALLALVCIRVVRVIRRQGHEPILSHELLYHSGVGVTLNNRYPVSGFCCTTRAVRDYQGGRVQMLPLNHLS